MVLMMIVLFVDFLLLIVYCVYCFASLLVLTGGWGFVCDFDFVGFV